jgi:hypothetical protein
MSSETTADTVPYARFRETIEKLREAEARIVNLEGEVKSAGTAAQRAAALEAELTAAKQAAEQTATRFDRWKALTSTGITHPDLASAIEAEYERIQPGDGGKRPDLVELVSAWKSKPDEAPFLLRPHLQALAPAAAPAAPAAPAPAGFAGQRLPAAPVPAADRGAVQQAPSAGASGKLTPEQWKATRAKLMGG